MEIIDSIKKCFVIAKYTYLEIIKSKILYGVAILGALLVLLVFISREFTYGVPERVAVDVGLGLLSLSTVGIAIFLGVNLLSTEIENRTLYMVVSKPIERWVFVIGKTLGLSLILFINVLLLGVITISSVSLLGGVINDLIYFVILFSLLEGLILMYVIVFFSLLTNKILSVLYGLVIFICGHAVSEVANLNAVKSSGGLAFAIELYSVFFPDLSRMNLKDHVVYQSAVDMSYLVGTSAYALTYLVFLSLLCCIIFKHKNLN